MLCKNFFSFLSNQYPLSNCVTSLPRYYGILHPAIPLLGQSNRTIEPMFTNVTNDLDIDDEVKQLAQQYSLLSDSDRELINRMIDSLAEKTNLP